MHGAHVPPEKNGQLVHGPEPVVLFHFATSHAVQTPPSGPVYPTLQVQLASVLQPLHEAPELAGHARQVVATMAPAVVENVAAAQVVHATSPVVVLYVPAAQAVHTPPFGPVYPTLQVQLASASQPLHEAPELSGHARQVVATVAPAVVENVPAAQMVHATVPVVVL